MSEYISREAVLKILCEKNAAWDAYQRVQSLPSADVRPVVKAEWYGEADGYADGELVYDIWSCPVCGKRFEEWEEKPDWNYCPNCGNDMREETE